MLSTPAAGRRLRPVMQDLGRLLREPWLLISILLIFAMLGIFIILPLIKVVDMSVASDGSPFEIYTNLFKSWYMRRAFTNSLLMGALSALTSVVVGFILAYTVTRVNIPFKRLIDMIAIIPIISPPFVSSLSILLLFGNNGLITYNLFGIRNFPIYGIRGLLLAQTVTFFPVAYLSLKGVLEAINPALEDAAFDLGASRWTVFRKITLPLAVPGIASAMLVVFIESLADFGNPLVLAGSAFPTLAVQAYLQITGMYDLPGGAALAVTLLIPSITAFVLQKYWVSRKSYVTVSGKPTRSTVKAVGPVMRWVLFGFAMAICVIVLGLRCHLVGAFSKAQGFDYGYLAELYLCPGRGI